ncbi:MAG: serine/threonine protein kinase [Actinobacteria bacterium]|nr:serine/threonine protein kinase [Actinomycetota bacterium]
MTPEAVTLARRYTLQDRIAGGGMGAVWRAKDLVLARTVAVKILHRSLSDNEQFVERFRREAFAAARLTHPNIVSIYDTGQEAAFDDDVARHYIVMEYCGGGTVATTLERGGPLEASEAFGIGSTICNALGYAHRIGVVHRDIKPENVLISEDGELKVADFGIAKAAFGLGDITTTGVILGTVTHISPEQAQGLEPDARSDLYALGVLLYQLLVGRPPFKAENEIATAMQHVRTKPPPLRSFKAGIPKAAEAVVLKALAKDPNERYQTAEEMRSALAGATSSAAPRAGRQTAVVESRHLAPATSGPPEATSEVDIRPGADPPPSTGSRSLIAVGLLVSLAILAAVLIPTLTDDPSGGNDPGGDGGRGRGAGQNGGTARIEVAEVADFDPHGDVEHPEETPNVVDESLDTEWTTETYSSPLTALKPGVGLVFDLGGPQTVERVEVASSAPGYTFELKQSNVVASDETGFATVETTSDAPAETLVSFEPVEARYWLLWITQLPGGTGGSASISEVEFFGT